MKTKAVLLFEMRGTQRRCVTARKTQILEFLVSLLLPATYFHLLTFNPYRSRDAPTV